MYKIGKHHNSANSVFNTKKQKISANFAISQFKNAVGIIIVLKLIYSVVVFKPIKRPVLFYHTFVFIIIKRIIKNNKIRLFSIFDVLLT